MVGTAVVSQVGYRQVAVHCDANREQDRADSFASGSMIAAASAGASIAAAAAPASWVLLELAHPRTQTRTRQQDIAPDPASRVRYVRVAR